MCYILFDNIGDWQMFIHDRSTFVLIAYTFFHKSIKCHSRVHNYLFYKEKKSEYISNIVLPHWNLFNCNHSSI